MRRREQLNRNGYFTYFPSELSNFRRLSKRAFSPRGTRAASDEAAPHTKPRAALKPHKSRVGGMECDAAPHTKPRAALKLAVKRACLPPCRAAPHTKPRAALKHAYSILDKML